MSELTWQGIVDQMQASGWAVDWAFDADAGVWRTEAINVAQGKHYAHPDASLYAALADLQTLTRGRLPLSVSA